LTVIATVETRLGVPSVPSARATCSQAGRVVEAAESLHALLSMKQTPLWPPQSSSACSRRTLTAALLPMRRALEHRTHVDDLALRDALLALCRFEPTSPTIKRAQVMCSIACWRPTR
jgi:hypothetical protein